ncbi:ABC transporter ATP-binding protein [Herminiimonas fonticola]|uniref:Amino acid/amide ABC transporter ATP-binding protein 2 (HAAT family) n=1 Tax=Herminiimonas fonticola TaxID=303380 RepID=A0A4R6G521_9BURK|nr:ABC transporter ATP-binding protein [Herminiimonas fonticola]RBA22979.1 ABC-type branched-chain amino acid transport systems ATPase component [Herminiimonas fonticola]TDN89579.1 amino acid/amide ABC transporter ATP-binding protein 2 (HAAT family) [Herminiimonas fonticola]
MSNLSVKGLTTGYDKVNVLHDVSIDVAPGKITCILGANGAGKSTLIRSILGLTPPRQGEILWGGRNLAGEKTHAIIASGISCIPEGRKVFPRMSVAENLALGAFLVTDKSVVAQRLERVYEIFPRLKERATQFAGTMSGGEQAMVSIGRGLMAEPQLLVIDEPSLGLSPLYVKENFKVIKQINAMGITVLLVEQNARQTLAISHYGYVLSQGRVMAQGTAEALASNDDVRSAYFG